MKKTLSLQFMLLILLSIMGCKKSNDVTDLIDTGNGDFIEFKIDGAYHKYALPS